MYIDNESLPLSICKQTTTKNWNIIYFKVTMPSANAHKSINILETSNEEFSYVFHWYYYVIYKGELRATRY